MEPSGTPTEATTLTEPTEPPSGAPAASETAREETAGGEERERGEDGRLLSREAARYRTQLREVQAERDRLREQLDQHQTVEVERLAERAGLAVAGDVWTFGATLDTLRDDTGSIDRETVEGVVADIVKSRPGLRAPVNGDIGIGRGAAARPPKPPAVGLSSLLKPGRA